MAGLAVAGFDPAVNYCEKPSKALLPAARESHTGVHCRAKLLPQSLTSDGRATLPDILRLEWKFEPADLFEQSTTARIGEYEFAIDWGRVQCQVSVDVESDDYWLRQRTEAQQRMIAAFLAAKPGRAKGCDCR